MDCSCTTRIRGLSSLIGNTPLLVIEFTYLGKNERSTPKQKI